MFMKTYCKNYNYVRRDFMSLLGENINRLLNANCMSVKDLAYKAGLSGSTIKNIIEDKHKPRKTTVECIARAFKVTEEELLGKMCESDVPNLGENIKTLCRLNGINQSRLALKAGITKQTISNIIKGKIKPRRYTLECIAGVFEMEVEELLGQ